MYSVDHLVCLKHNGRGFPRRSSEQKNELELLPSELEIKRVVWSCESPMAPGYDGLNLGFIKKLWDAVGEHFTRMIMEFFEQKELPKSVNTTCMGHFDPKDRRSS